MNKHPSAQHTEYSYSVIASTPEQLEEIEVYGILAQMWEHGKLISAETLEGIFCTREEAEEFAAVLSENGVDPCHLADVAEDWLVR